MTREYYYDLHIHSCLSPCGDDDMTPNNIAGMGKITGLDIMALTDHNSCKNCPAFFEAAQKYGIIPVPGMELTTAEDIHIVCLFDCLEAAMKFDEDVDRRRVLIKNRTDIFGNQFIMNGNDEITGEDENMLPNATSISLDEVVTFVEEHGGVCYPAHIDREANGIIATLGTFPDFPEFRCAELHDRAKQSEYRDKYPRLKNMPLIFSSDAHYLEHIGERENSMMLSGETPDEIRKALIEKIRNP